MLYAAKSPIVNRESIYHAIICTTQKTIFKAPPRKLLHMLDNEKIQKMLGKRKYYIKYRGHSQTLQHLYNRAQEKGLKRWGDIPVSMLR